MTRTGHKPNAEKPRRPYLHYMGPRMVKSVGLSATFLLVVSLTGCLQGSVTAYKPDPEFVDLYAELKLASLALHQDLEKAGEIRRVILAQHGMTPAEFHEHFMQLTAHPEAWQAFQDGVVARIDAFQPKPEVTPEGATDGK